jgi:oligopeptide/dipeptide ABC transporter ATP-binding protein
MTALLEIEDLRILLRAGDHREIALVDGVSLAVAPGRVVGLAGESGSGKTLTGLSTMGFFPDRSRATGAVRIGGEDVLRMKSSRLRRMRGREVAIVFQDPMTSLHPMLTVGRQLTEHVRVHLGLSQKDADARAVELLTTVRLPDPERVLASYPHEFSGGMRQRIAIASALACDPKLLIADEPTTALDVTVQAQVLALINDLKQRLGMAMLLITHDLGVVAETANRVIVMYAGRKVEEGSTTDIFDDPLHPYARGLLKAARWESQGGEDLWEIPGTVPSPLDLPPGCAFAPRCPLAEARCRAAVPPPVALGPRRSAACIKAEAA